MAYKLTYFNLTALAEPIRFLLSYGNLEFEDVRIERDQWPSVKRITPFGKLPTLEYQGQVAHQSTAISRYVAKKVGLVGNDDWENLEIDATVDTINDLHTQILKSVMETDEKLKESLKLALFKDTLPFYLGKLEEQSKTNVGYLAAGRLTWADLYFTSHVEYFNIKLGKDLLAGYSNLEALRDRVMTIPNIKKWIEKRPVTDI